MGRVEKVWGNANGATVIFERQEGDFWKIEVPWTDDGEYVLSVWAEDTAGNVGYLCTMLFVISGHELQGYVVPRGFTGAISTNEYTGFPTIEEFLATLQETPFVAHPEEVEYQAEVQEGGYTIERVICSRDAH